MGHPLDPLSVEELQAAVATARARQTDLRFNSVSLEVRARLETTYVLRSFLTRVD